MSKPIEAELTHISLLSGILENSEPNLQPASGYSIGLYIISIFVYVLTTPDLIIFCLFFGPHFLIYAFFKTVF